MDNNLYGFYRKNILLHDNFIKNQQEAKKPQGCLSRFWNWKPKHDYLTLQILRDWSIHGTKYILQPERHIVERVFWTITVLCSTGAAAYLSHGVVQKYNQSPVIVSFQPSQTSVSQVPFPAVTICNVNRFRKSSFERALRKVSSSGAETKPGYRDNLILLRQLEHICSATKSFSTKFRYSLEETTVDLAHRGLEDDLDRSDITVNSAYQPEHLMHFEQSFQNCSEMIHLCIWEGEEFECSSEFYPIITDLGICCVMNMMPSPLLLKKSASDPGISHSEKAIFNKTAEYWKEFDLDLNIVERDTSKEKILFPKHQSKAGQGSGLSVLLYPDVNEYFCTGHDGFGFRIFPHSPIEFPHVLEFGLAVGPNAEMFVNLQAEVTVAEKDIKSLSADERHCYFLKDMTLENYAHYTSANCIDECIMNRTVKECDCILYHMQQSNGTNRKYCEGSNFTCAIGIQKQVGMQGTKKFCKDCLSSCNKILYDTQTSSLPLRTDVNIWNHPKRQDWTGKNVSIVHVYFGSDSVYTRVRKRLFGFSELFANVGGILGLFLGFSVISAVEPGYYLIRLLTHSENDDDNESEDDH